MIRISALILTLAASAFAAEPVAMFVPKAVNVDPSALEAFGAICAFEYGKVAQTTVISPADAAKALGENGSLTDAAKALNAHELVEIKLVNLSTAHTPGRWMISAVRRAADGRELYRAELPAASLDDAVPVCERLALSLTNAVPPEETVNRHNVSAAEVDVSNNPNRVGTEKLLGVKTQFAQPVAAGSQGVNPIAGVAFDARFEHERYFFEIGAGIIVPAVLSRNSATYGGISSEIGASYFLTTGDTGVYLGAGVQPRIIFSGSVMNLAPYAQLGVEFSRQSSTRIYADVRLSQNILPVVNSYSADAALSTSLFPTELGVQLGIGF